MDGDLLLVVEERLASLTEKEGEWNQWFMMQVLVGGDFTLKRIDDGQKQL